MSIDYMFNDLEYKGVYYIIKLLDCRIVIMNEFVHCSDILSYPWLCCSY